MANRLVITFTDVVQSIGFLDVTASDVTSFVFTTPSLQGEIEVMSSVNLQAQEFFTRFNTYYNGTADYETYVEDNVVYIVDTIDQQPIFDDAATNIPEVTLLVESLEEYGDLYSGSYTDLENIDHSFGIKKKEYYGFSSVVSGACSLRYADSEDIDNSIIGNGLTISLDADTSLTYEDLYIDGERNFLVSYTRDTQVLFNGWLTPEGFFEDFVSDKWVITLDCTDGLGFLQDLSYVDSNGLFYTGKQSQLEIIVNCLNRTGISQEILTNVDIYYNGLATTLDILDNVYYNADRFVKDDGDTIMSCEEVLNDILEPYKATIISFNGQWIIFKLNQMFIEADRDYFKYDSTGLPLTGVDFSNGRTIGSQIDSYYPHHANNNQSLSNRKSIGAYRVSYKYGFDKSILDNTRLFWSGSSIDEWTINDILVASASAGDYGIDLELASPVSIGATSDVISLSADDVINYSGSFTTHGDAILFYSKAKLVNGGTTYYLLNSGEWTTTDSFVVYENSVRVPSAVFPEQDYVGTEASLNFSIDSAKLPISGNLTIEFFASRVDNTSGDSVGYVTMTSISIAAVRSDTNVIGEFHTVQREDNPSAKVKDVKEVNVGDNPSDLYLGTIYKADETSPTIEWFRKGVTESVPLIRLMSEETLRLNANTSRIFTGDCYGYLPYYSTVSINNITGVFTPIQYNYDSVTNITALVLKQIFGSELTDINYELTYNYGNTVKPTIVG